MAKSRAAPDPARIPCPASDAPPRTARSQAALLVLAASLGLSVLAACPRATEPERRSAPGARPVELVADEPPHAATEHPTSDAVPAHALPPLQGAWLERLGTKDAPVVVTPPLGAVEPRPLVVGVHGAGDRPEWACGGWRLAAEARAFVACPQGSPMPGQSFGWASPSALARRVDDAVTLTRERYGAHIAAGAMIYAGFSQGATFAEPFLRKNAARFPIVILAEGGYQTSRDPSFARAFREAGGRRIVLVCGSAACFRSAIGARKVLEAAGIEALVVGDELAGHNLNERMQHALEKAWAEITAPLADGTAH